MAVRLEKNRELADYLGEPLALESLEATGSEAEALRWTWVSWPAVFGDEGALSEDLGDNSFFG